MGYPLHLDVLADGEVELPSVFIFLTPPQDVAKWAPQGHPTLPAPFFLPNVCCFSAQILVGGGWRQSLADGCLPLGSLEEEKQAWLEGPLGKQVLLKKGSVRDLGSWSQCFFLQVSFTQYKRFALCPLWGPGPGLACWGAGEASSLPWRWLI